MYSNKLIGDNFAYGMCTQWNLRTPYGSVHSEKSRRRPPAERRDLRLAISVLRRLWSDCADSQTNTIGMFC